jgi:hypothetical protein
MAKKEALKVVVPLLESTFNDREHMIRHKNEIKHGLRAALSEEKQEVLTLTDTFVGNKGKTAEQKELMGQRTKFGKVLNDIYIELLKAAFPVDEDVPAKKITSAIKAATPDAKATTPDAKSTTPNAKSTTSDAKFATPDAKSTTLDMKDLSSAIGEILSQKGRAKRPNKLVDTDLFETTTEATLALGDYLDIVAKSGSTVLEPAAGHGAIVKVLESKGINVIAQDKYTMPQSIDFLTAPLPPGVHMIITCPPPILKWEFLARIDELGLPTFVLLPLAVMATKKWFKLFGDIKFDVIIINGPCNFIHAGRFRNFGPCAWFLFTPGATGKMSLTLIGDLDDVDLGDEDSVDGRGYDPDEKACEDMDNAILNDPNAKFTKEGYHIDGTIVPDNDGEIIIQVKGKNGGVLKGSK